MHVLFNGISGDTRYRAQFETFRKAVSEGGLKMAYAPHDLPNLQQRTA